MAMDAASARHLLSRTGFGPTQAELDALVKQDTKKAIRQLVAQSKKAAPLAVKPPEGMGREQVMQAVAMAEEAKKTDEGKKQLQRMMRQNAQSLKGWWIEELVKTSRPLNERMTLMWHNHFTSSFRTIKRADALFRQNQTLRAHALGSFRALLKAMIRDPALLAYLDNHTNHKKKPNENFARELLELFTLGEGHYKEQDIKEAARAFTGWGVKRPEFEFELFPNRHDSGPKTFLGVTGPHDGDAIVDILLKQPACAAWIVRKVWREFVGEEIALPAEESRRLEAIFRQDYQIHALVEAVLLSEAFLDPANRGAKIKSPADLIVGTARVFGVVIEQPEALAQASARLGQDLFDPPNVKGWSGGKAWITSDALLARQQIISRVFRDPEGMPGLMNRGFAALLGPGANKLADVRQRAVRLLLPVEPIFGVPDEDEPLPFLAALVSDPAYQLK